MTSARVVICICIGLIPGGQLQSADVKVADVDARDGVRTLSGNSADAVLKFGLKQTINRFAQEQAANGNNEDRLRLPQIRAPLKQCGIPGTGDMDSFRVGNNRILAKNVTTFTTFRADLEAKLAPISQSDIGDAMRLIVDHRNTHAKREVSVGSRKKRGLTVQVGAKFVQPTIVGGFDAVPNQICWQGTCRCTEPGCPFRGTGGRVRCFSCGIETISRCFAASDVDKAKITIQLSGGLATCGGSLVGPRTIITAAHCTLNPFVEGRKEQIPANSFTVQIGAMTRSFNQFNPSADKTGCAQNFKVSRVITHPDYSQDVGDNDIGMLILDNPVDIDGKQCACLLCLRNEIPQTNELCVVSGYGDETEGGSGNRFPVPLKYVRVQVLDQSMDGTCAVSTDSRGRSTNLDRFICAGNIVGEDSCQGDSGGPLSCFDQNTQAYYLAGLVSFGDGCGTGIGGQYTKIQRFMPWISANAFPDVVLG